MGKMPFKRKSGVRQEESPTEESPNVGAEIHPESGAGQDTRQTCANCGMRQDAWRTPQGYQQDGETFCCEGCATGTGSTR
jgi:hypothetical protein